MNELLQTVDELRRMSTAELAQVAEDGLMGRLREQAGEARLRHGGLRPSNLETFLSDRDCVRYPTRLVLEYGEMGMHQFAQPEPDIRNPGGIMLYLRPSLGRRPDLMALAISYMIPVINYRDAVGDEHCLSYGSQLMGLDEETYYLRICDVADFVGAEQRIPDDPGNPFSDPSHATNTGLAAHCGHGACGFRN